MRFLVLLCVFSATSLFATQSSTTNAAQSGPPWNLMPVPAKVDAGSGQWVVQQGLTIALSGADDPRVRSAAQRFVDHLSRQSGIPLRYLTAEAEALKSGPWDLAVTPANYKFKYKGLVEKDGRKVYAFHVSPRKKRVGLFDGELWLDPETHLAVRESGRMVKSPSVFVKKIEFVREYEIMGGIAVPRRIESLVDTRLVGKAKLTVAFTSFSLGEQAQAVLTGGGI